MNKEKYMVWASHVSPDFALKGATIQVHQNYGDGSWYANHGKLGCEKDYPTPESAIRGLLRSHAYESITMRKVQHV